METRTFTLSRRYLQNRVTRELPDVAIVGQYKFRVSIEINEAQAGEMLLDAIDVIATVQDEPGLISSAQEFRNAVLAEWPNLPTEDPRNDDRRSP